MDGLYKSRDSSPTTDSTLTSAPILVDGQYCVCHSSYWSRYRAFGIDLGGSETIEWIQLYGKRSDETTPVTWYNEANEFTVYKSDNNSDWTHVDDFVMQPEDIHPVAGSCAYWILPFSESHNARYFKVIATAYYGAAWNADGGSIIVGQVIAASSSNPSVQFMVSSHSSGPGLVRRRETGARFGISGRSSEPGLEMFFSQHFPLSTQSSAPDGRFQNATLARFFNQVRTAPAAGRVHMPSQARLINALRSSTSLLWRARPAALPLGLLVRSSRAKGGKHLPAAVQNITSVRSRPANLHPLFAAAMATAARSSGARVSGQVRTQVQIHAAIRSSGRGVYQIYGRERLLCHLIEQGRLILDGGLIISGRQRLGIRLTAGASSRQRVVYALAQEPRPGRQTMIQILENQAKNTGRQRLRTDLLDYDSQIIVPLDWDILMDDVSIKHCLIEPLSIVSDENGIHNQLTIESADRDLFQLAQPLQERGVHSLVVRLGTRELFFILTDRSGDQDRFTLVGFSQSIELDHPYQTEISFNQDYEVLEFRQGQFEITAGRVITGNLSGACGLVVSCLVASGNWSQGTARGRLYLDQVQGDFVEEGLDTGQTSNAAWTDGHLTTTSLSRSAAEVAKEMAGAPGLTWDQALPDWVLPADTQLEGYPLDIITELAQAVGGIVRGQDDGQLLVRPSFPVRPIHLPDQHPVALYDRTLNIIQIDLKEKTGTQYNAIEVNGYSEEILLPQFEFETPPHNHFQSGEDLFARVYWTAEPPGENPVGHWTSAGDVEYLGCHLEQVQDERVLLEQGRASTAKPVLDMVSIKWVGSKGWGIHGERYSREIRLVGANEDDISSLFRIAKITYTSQYDRYRVKNHNVQALLLALEMPSSPAVAVKVKYAAESEYPAEAIDAPLLTTIEAAVFRGQAELDRSSYHCQTVQLLAPYNPLVRDGVIVEINDDRFGIQGNFHVSQAQIRIQGPVILHRLECIQPLV